MPRSLWTGSLSFGLVNVPVALHSGARDRDYHFRQLHEQDATPIEQRTFCSEEDVEVGWEEIGHGYELDDGRQVVLTDEELDAAQPRKTRTIDIEAFVDLADVDPIYFDHPYVLVPAGESEGSLRSYRLLVEVMDEERRAAVGRFVMRTKEYLVLLRAREGALALTTMRFADEVRPADEIPTGAARKPAKAKLDQAVALVEALSTDWEPERYEDCYRTRLRRVIERKKAGKRITAPRPEKAPSAVPDLMAALKRSLDEARGREGDSPGAGESGDGSRRDELRDMSRDELYELAQDEQVRGRSSMSKDELVEALAGS